MASSHSFDVQRQEPVLVAPAEPTPRELKPLSDIDDQQGLRYFSSCVLFYKSNPKMIGKDPVRAIREGVAKALVHYYPLAGRLRDGPGGKLVVECTGEGCLFVEANANIRLEQLGDPPQPPSSFMEELSYNPLGANGIINCPLAIFQVTRLLCGGFVVALQANHIICDAMGLMQFMCAVGEMARGVPSLSVRPVWARELLCARTPPRITHDHREYDDAKVIDPNGALAPNDPLTCRSFFFGPSEMTALRNHLPPHLRKSSTFDIISACIWRCRNAALLLHPEQEVRMLFHLTIRGKPGSVLPLGYYGNTVATPVVVSTAGKLCRKPLDYAVELIRKTKSEVTHDYIQSVADLMVLRGRPPYSLVHTFRVSDLTRVKFDMVDFGWGTYVHVGQASSWNLSYYLRSKNCKGEDGVSVLQSLPAAEMERFVAEIENITEEPKGEQYNKHHLSSSL